MRQEQRGGASYCSTKYIRKENLKTSNSKWKYERNYFYKNKKKLLFLLFSLQTRLSNVKMEHVLVTTSCLTLNLLNTTALTTPSSPRQHNTLVSLLNTFSKTSTCRIFISSAVCSKLGWNLDGGKTACARFPLWCPKTSDTVFKYKRFFSVLHLDHDTR